MPLLTEKTHAGSFLLSEAPRFRSRENGKINTPQNLDAGTVLGRLLTAAAPVAGTNTGNGVVTVGVMGLRTVIGIYKLICRTAAVNAGTFDYLAPDGTLIRQITVAGGAHTSDHPTVTIADGATDFVVGDSFTFDVTGGDYEQLDTAATTGEQAAAGVLLDATDATAADKAGCVIARDAEVNGNELVWPGGISAANKTIAIARLGELGILVR